MKPNKYDDDIMMISYPQSMNVKVRDWPKLYCMFSSRLFRSNFEKIWKKVLWLGRNFFRFIEYRTCVLGDTVELIARKHPA